MRLKRNIEQAVLTMLSVHALFLALPIGVFFSSLTMGVLVTLTLVYGVLHFKEIAWTGGQWIFAIPFLIYGLGLFNTSDLDAGFSFVFRNIGLLLFPFVFTVLKNSPISIARIARSYLIGAFVSSLYLVVLFVYYFHLGTKFTTIIRLEIFHATYLGMYLLLAVVFSMWLYFREYKKLYLLLSVFFLVAALLASSRIVFVIAFLLAAYYSFRLLRGKKYLLPALLLTLGLFLAAPFVVPSISSKFNQFAKLEQLGFDPENYHSLSSRFAKNEAACELVKQYPLFGVGTGDLTQSLVEEYEKMGFVMGYKNAYNAHNQYLEGIARNGILLGGISLFFLYVLPLLWGLRAKDRLLILPFMGIVSIASLTESILDVHRGIMFYAFFVNLLLLMRTHGRDPNKAV